MIRRVGITLIYNNNIEEYLTLIRRGGGSDLCFHFVFVIAQLGCPLFSWKMTYGCCRQAVVTVFVANGQQKLMQNFL